MKKLSYLSLFAACLFVSLPHAEASKAKPFKCQEDADIYLMVNYNEGCKYYNKQNYRKAYSHFEKVIHFFPSSEAAAEASYYLGVCYYEMQEYDFANSEFSSYITASAHPAFFEDAVRFKFCIAEHFRHGKKRRPFTSRYCPKWLSAEDEALKIYDEVIIALPNHELTICALQSKAELLRHMREYRESIDTYQTLIRRFPKDESTPESYVRVAEIYREQSQYEFQNPDILALAELNARKFSEEFPRDERVEVVNDSVLRIKEIYAKGLCNLGLFYERKGHPHAAAIYYKTSIAEFPDTAVACFCRTRLETLDYSKEKKDVIVPIATLIEERDPLAFEEKATPAEGDAYETLPIAPALEADRPTEEAYNQSIKDIVGNPDECSQDQAPEIYDQAPVEPVYEQAPVDAPLYEQPQENAQFYDEPIPADSFNEGMPHHATRNYYQDFESSDFFVVEEPVQASDGFYPASDKDIYGGSYEVIGHEQDCYVTFENGETINHWSQPVNSLIIYSDKTEKECEVVPKTFLHYSLLKSRAVKRANSQ